MTDLAPPMTVVPGTSVWRRLAPDRLVSGVLALLLALACLISLLMAWVILSGSLEALQNIPLARFVADQDWHPTEDHYDLKPMLVGSLLSSAGAIAVAVPVSLAIAAALNFYVSPFWASVIRRLLFVMASVPTVIFGFWGLTQLVPLIARISPPGVSLLSGTLILALMIIPTATLLIDVALLKIPKTLIDNAYALGASRHRVCFGMALPVAKSGVFSATLLSLGRALGETIIVVMVTGNKAEMPTGLFDPIRTLTANVALEVGYADQLHASILFLSILFLFALTTVLSLGVYLAAISAPKRVDV